MISYIFVLFLSIRSVNSDENERRLYDLLLLNYNVYERPVENNSFPVVVQMKIFLNQIVDVVKLFGKQNLSELI